MMWDKSLKKLHQANDIDLKEQLKHYESLDDIQKRLFNLNFPVLYGIRPTTRRTNTSSPLVKMAKHEILLREGVSVKEIRVIFVPQEEIRFVKFVIGDLGKHIKVKAIESLRN